MGLRMKANTAQINLQSHRRSALHPETLLMWKNSNKIRNFPDSQLAITVPEFSSRKLQEAVLQDWL
jgi:hypothetical protein